MMHNATMQRLQGANKADAEKTIINKMLPAAKNQETRAELNRLAHLAVETAYDTISDNDRSKYTPEEQKIIAEGVLKGIFQRCMQSNAN